MEGDNGYNMDTNFLKVVAVIAMVLDHMGKVFFPDVQILQGFAILAVPFIYI